ncbi:myosin-7 [Diachasma alloeum]|uniref:myosin-7 n=1 Tax=Diachasma alloeum TaxID=454923 RepID=UPI000738418C|nr:myosin-7 [Diachasma alloeum]
MSENFIDSSRCLSPGDQKIPLKRQKLDTSNNSSSLNTSGNYPVRNTEWETTCMKEEIARLRKKLLQTEALLKLREQKRELFQKEMDMLEMQLQVEAETTERLHCDLETAIRNIHAAHEAQMTAEDALSEAKTSMEKEIRELMNENACLAAKTIRSSCMKTPAPSQFQEDATETQRKLKTTEQRIIKLEEQLEGHLTLQAQFDRQKRKLEEAEVTIQKLKAELFAREHPKELSVVTRRLEHLEQGSLDANKFISPLRAVEEKRHLLEKQRLRLQKRLEEKGDSPLVQEDVEILFEGNNLPMISTEMQTKAQDAYQLPDVPQITIKIDPDLPLSEDDLSNAIDHENEDDCDSTDAFDHQSSSSTAPDKDVSPSLRASKNINSSSLKSKKAEPRRVPACTARKDSFVRPTNPKFFEINWDREYSCPEKGTWACKKCPEIFTRSERMQDHVWVTHYGEKFECVHCCHRLSWRGSIGVHNKKEHPQLINQRKSKKEIR